MPKLIDISKKWGNRSIFDNFCIEFDKDKTTAIIGKSGIGKTTLLQIIAKLTDFDGEIIDFGKISYVFQEPRLLPFLTVKENLEYALSNDCLGDDKDKTINKYLELTEISHLKNKKANTLSGGEAQRVSLARAFCYPSNTILCDEPFSSLDLGLKKRIMGVYNDLIKASPRTSIMVTHTIDEALFLADVIIYLDNNTFKRFENPTPRALRNFGYEADNTLRKTLNDLFS